MYVINNKVMYDIEFMLSNKQFEMRSNLLENEDESYLWNEHKT